MNKNAQNNYEPPPSDFIKHINTPLISVCIPAFNHEKFVSETIESVVNSTYPNIEIIVIDDGSTDKTYSIASQLIDRNSARFKRSIIKKQTNVGINRTINLLVNESKGEYIYILASDDLLPPDALEKLLQEHKKIFNGSPGLLFYDVRTISEQSDTIEESTLKCRHHEYLPALLKNRDFLFFFLAFRWETPFQHQFYSRSAYDFIGGYPESLHVEDVYFGLTGAGRSIGALTTVVGKWYRLREMRGITPGLTKRQYAGISSKKEAINQVTTYRKFILLASIFLEYITIRFSQRAANYVAHRIVRIRSRLIMQQHKKNEK